MPEWLWQAYQYAAWAGAGAAKIRADATASIEMIANGMAKMRLLRTFERIFICFTFTSDEFHAGMLER